MNTPHLKRAYRRFNNLYWDNRLPDATVRFDGNLPRKLDGHTVVTATDEQITDVLIKVDPTLRDSTRLYSIVLLHEMAHVACYPDMRHSRKFKDEIQRLIGRGAFNDLL